MIQFPEIQHSLALQFSYSYRPAGSPRLAWLIFLSSSPSQPPSQVTSPLVQSSTTVTAGLGRRLAPSVAVILLYSIIFSHHRFHPSPPLSQLSLPTWMKDEDDDRRIPGPTSPSSQSPILASSIPKNTSPGLALSLEPWPISILFHQASSVDWLSSSLAWTGSGQ